MLPISIIALVVGIALHHALGAIAAIALKTAPSARDEIFAHGSNQLFGPPIYMRAKFLLPWVRAKQLNEQPPKIRALVLSARLAGMAAIVGLLVCVISAGAA